MNTILILYALCLFFIFSPGIVISLPKKINETIRRCIHAILFAFVFTFTYPWILLMKSRSFIQEGVVMVEDAGADIHDSLIHLASPKPDLIAKPREERALYVAKAHDLAVSPNYE